MAYFDCIVGGSGGKWKLTVTCTNVFAGLTITCTDGTITLTKTCPSSSPYTVVFNIPNGGTWTISGTVSGQTGTTTVIIPDNATLNPPIPTGSTVTPVNDIQIWLHCANIWDKTYTTINQVLADNSTLLALISSNNAADYMARSTNWASSVCANQTAMGYIGNNDYCANKLLADSTWLDAICNSTYMESVLTVKVPTMTSSTTPSGDVITNYEQSGYYAYYVFDGNDNTYWNTYGGGGEANKWVGYSFTRAVGVRMATILGRSDQQYNSIKDYKIQGSNDGFVNDINTLKTGQCAQTRATTKVIFPNNSNYKYMRVYVDNTWTNVIGAATIQFYGR
jgi:hypothetical protein